MPTTIRVTDCPIGFAATSARPGETVAVQTRDFVSSEDGDRLVDLLDQISEVWLSRLPEPPQESTIDHVVIVCRRDGTAQIFVNEVPIHALMSIKAARIEVGEMVACDAVADTHEMVLEGVEIPANAGVLVVLSARWRRGVLYDFAPLTADGAPREAKEVERMLAGAWTYLQFQDRIGLSDEDWIRVTAAGWFPFIGLPMSRVKAMRRHVRAGWPVDELLPEILADVRANLARLRQQVETRWLFDDHRATVLQALHHFERGEYLTVATMLYTRIEGLLRAQHARVTPGTPAKQSALAKSAAVDVGRRRHEFSLLLPSRFEAYLRDVCFAHFDPAAPNGVSRNTVGHGVAPEAELGEKAAAIAILIVEQLAFMCASDASVHPPA